MWLKQTGAETIQPVPVSALPVFQLGPCRLFLCSSPHHQQGGAHALFSATKQASGCPRTRPEQLAVSGWPGQRQEMPLNGCWCSDTSLHQAI